VTQLRPGDNVQLVIDRTEVRAVRIPLNRNVQTNRAGQAGGQNRDSQRSDRQQRGDENRDQ
jgi:hypothetical protein